MPTEDVELEDQFVEDVQHADGGAADAGKEPVDPAKPVDPAVTQSSLDAAFEKLGTTITKAVTPKEQAQAQQMSPEEQKKLWAIYDPEEGQKDFMRKFFRMNPDATEDEVKEARGMFKNLQEGLVKQAVVGSRNLMQIELEKLHSRYAPLEDFYRQAQAEKLQTDFFKAYPALGEVNDEGSPKYMKAIHIAANELANQTFAGRPEYFKALADRAAVIVKGFIPDFDLGVKTKTSTTTPSLPRTRVGGSGGTAAGGGTGDGKSVRGANGDDASTLDWNS